MRLNILLLVLLVVFGLGISLLLIPRDKDVALLKLRSDEADEARQVLLEQYDRGDRSVAVVASLAEIAIYDGEIPTAIQLLEEYVANNPKDIAARRRLAEYYRFDQRRDDYVAMLADVVGRDGTVPERRLLTDLYRLRGDYDLLLQALSDMMERGIAREREFREAAALSASLKQYDQSLAASEAMWRAFPASFGADTVKLYVMVAEAAGKSGLADQIVARLASGLDGPRAIVPVIREVSDRDQPELGLRLLRQFEGELYKTPPLLVAWARMQESLDQELVALERLRQLETEGNLPALAVPVLLDLAILAGDLDLIVRVVQPRDMANFNDFRLRAIADLAVHNRSGELLRQFLEQAPDRLKRREPALLAEVHIALGQTEKAAEQVALARQLQNRRLDQLLRLARAEIKLGQEEAAATTLDRIAALSDLDQEAMRSLAQLYIDTERTRKGLAAFERLRTEQPSLAADYGWARLAASEGRDTELREWMLARSGLDKDLLTDIAFLSLPDRAPASALEAARRLFDNHPGRDSRRLLGEALLANGNVSDAIAVLKPLTPGNAEEAETWVAALTQAGRNSDALSFLISRADEGPLEPRLADDLIYLALDADRSDLAFREIGRQPISRVDEEAVAAVIERAAQASLFDLIEQVLADAGTDFLNARPVLAAQIELSRGNREQVLEWANRAVARADLRNAETIGLAGVFAQLDQPARSLSLLQGLADDPDTPAFALADLGAQYLALGRAEDGLPVFQGLRETRLEPVVAEAWARLEVTGGDPARVLSWLRDRRTPSRQLLTDLYFMARERAADDLALLASERLVEDWPGPESDRIHADMLLATGQPARALPVIERLLPGDDDTAQLYVSALTAAARPADALRFLEERAAGEPQPVLLADDLIGLAFGEGRPDLAYAEAERQDLRKLDDAVLASVAENAANDRHFDLFDQIVNELGPAFLEQRPVLAARLALARDRAEEARRWADQARQLTDLENQDAIALAGVYSGLGEQATALDLLRSVAEEPSTPVFALADLGAAYLALGRSTEGLELFRRLREDRPHPSVTEAWARLETTSGDPETVRGWLETAGNPSAQVLQDVHYLAAERRADTLAFLAGQRFYEGYPGPESRRIHATSLMAVGRAEDAVPILKELLPGDDEVAEAYAAALSATDRKAEALAFLRARANGEALPIRIADDYMALAIELDQPELAYAHARLHDMSDFDDNTIASLTENAAEDGDLELVDQIVEQTGPAFWEKFPVMAARIEIARRNQAAAREWADRALSDGGLDNRRLLRLAAVYSDLSEIETSLGILETLADDPETPAFAISDMASQYLLLGQAERGLPVLRDLVERRSEPLVSEGWARLETRAGDPSRVLRWLKESSSPSRQVLTDLYFLAQERDAEALALEASERLIDRFPGRDASLIRGQALTAAGRGKEAIPLLQPLLPGTREVRSAYVAALGQSGDTTELKAFAERVLDDPQLDPQIRSALLFALLEAGAGDVALPQLRELARRDPGTWEAAYLDALRQAGADEERAGLIEARLKAGPRADRRDALLFELLDVGGPRRALPWLRQAAEADPRSTWPSVYETALSDLGLRQELIDWLEERGRSPRLKEQTRREAGFRLLDLNAKLSAEKVFLTLAAEAKPTSPDVQQLLYLWGPKPPRRGLDWLIARTESSSGGERANWIRLLANARAYNEVIALGASPAPTDAHDARLQPLVTAYIETGRRDDVSALLDPVIATTGDHDDLLDLADLAEQAVQEKTAVTAYEKALNGIGNDAGKLLKAGRAFAFGGRAELAVETMERYFQADRGAEVSDHRPWYYYALGLAQMNRQAEARSAYRQMLAAMSESGAKDFQSRRMQAVAYEAIGDGDQAVAIYRQLLAERPRDRSLVADFASLLIELRRYDEAELLLGQN